MTTVAKLVDELFRTHRRSDGREYTYKDVSLALGGVVEPSHISKLRTGKIANPGRETLLCLCRFFHVAPSYFFPELDSTYAQEKSYLNSLRVALATAGLGTEVEEKLEELIRALQREKERTVAS